MNKFSINENRFYYFYRKIKYGRATLPELIEFLNARQCEIRSNLSFERIEEIDELPELLIVVSPKMK